MYKRHIIFALSMVVVLGHAVLAQNFPEHYDNYVNDFADLLSPSEEERVQDMLRPLREIDDIEFVVVTINRMSDYGHSGTIEPFATGLFNDWGVGHPLRNDGVMLLVSRYDRKLRIEVGSGYGTSKNRSMKKIIDRTIVPNFKNNNYVAGIQEGVQEAIRDLTGSYPDEGVFNFAEPSQPGIFEFLKSLGTWLLVSIASVVLFITSAAVMAWRRWRRNRPRLCPNDHSAMIRLSETTDNDFLDPGQNTEERLTSVDYDVWQCNSCGHLTIEGYRKWFSGYGACTSCNYKTLEGETTIIKSATRSSTGEKRIDYYCHNCQHRYSVTKIIPKKSDSSGRSSFGGGSSGGGGASGSW